MPIRRKPARLHRVQLRLDQAWEVLKPQDLSHDGWDAFRKLIAELEKSIDATKQRSGHA